MFTTYPQGFSLPASLERLSDATHGQAQGIGPAARRRPPDRRPRRPASRRRGGGRADRRLRSAQRRAPQTLGRHGPRARARGPRARATPRANATVYAARQGLAAREAPAP